MSWSIQSKSIKREEAFDRICELAPNDQMDGPARAQFETAKEAAIEIVAALPGPYVRVSLSGHSNGIGWQEKSGYSYETISVSVTQCMVELYPHEK